MAVAPRRPGVVTFIGVIMYVLAALSVVGGLTFVILSGNDALQQQIGHGSDVLLATGIVELLVGAITYLVARGVMAGAEWARLFVVIVQGLRMASAVVLMIVHSDGGYLFSGLLTLLVGAFVIWALYGNEAADEYFTRQEGRGTASPPPPATA